jgi:hypothetical protein
MTFKTRWPLLGLIIGVLALGCDKDDDCTDPSNMECSNYDPCWNGYVSKAEFKISNRVNTWQGWQFFADTMFGLWDPLLYFDASYPDEVNSHAWYLGAEVITDASFIRDFQNEPFPSDYTVSHVVTYDELDPCKPGDNGRDSVAVNFRLVGSYFEFVSIGTFRGRHNGSEEYEWSVYPITIAGDTAFTVYETEDFRYVNFHNTGEVADYYAHRPTNRKVSVPGGGSSNPKGIYQVDINGKIVFNYIYGAPPTTWVFQGNKID